MLYYGCNTPAKMLPVRAKSSPLSFGAKEDRQFSVFSDLPYGTPVMISTTANSCFLLINTLDNDRYGS